VAATLVILLALFGLARLERRIRKDWYKVLVVETRALGEDLSQLRQVLSAYDVEIRDFEIKRTDRPDASVVELNVKMADNRDEDGILSDVLRLDGTKNAHWA